MKNQSAGWYPNPDSPGGERWWNGSSWSDHTRGDPIGVSSVPGAPGAQRSSKSKKLVLGCLLPLLLGVIVLGIVAGFVNAVKESFTPNVQSVPVESSPASLVLVTYDLSGTAADVTVMYSTPTGSEQHDVSPPLLDADGATGLQFEFRHGDYVSLSAQNSCDHGTVTCTITADGEVISQNTSSSAFGFVRCDGSLPWNP